MKKERNKDSPYYQKKAFIQKDRFMIQKSTKNILALGSYKKFNTLARLDQSV